MALTPLTLIVSLLWTPCVQTCHRHHQTVEDLKVIVHRHLLMACTLTGRHLLMACTLAGRHLHRLMGKVVLPTNKTICVASILPPRMTWTTTA